MERASGAERYLQGLAAFLLYVLVELLLFGRTVLPHMSTSFMGASEGDLKWVVWSVEWWPHAVAHGLNPFLPRVLAPLGLNLGWAASVPGPSLVMAPVTALFGPIATYNALLLLGGPLGAWSTYLLCRYITKAFWPSIAGGFFFGFASFELGSTKGGYLYLELAFVLPLLAYLVLRRINGDVGSGRFVLLVTLALTF